MKENEIRINNLVTVNNPKYWPELKDIPLKVIGITPTTRDGVNTFSISLEHINQIPNKYYESYSQFIDFIEPIPITDEILLKSGFNSNDNPVLTFGNNFEYIEFREKTNTIHIWASDGCTEGHNIAIEMKGIHHLQNIILDMTGKEWIINL